MYFPLKYFFFQNISLVNSTVSEARSYDETTIQPPTKTLRSIYDKQSSHLNNDVSIIVNVCVLMKE